MSIRKFIADRLDDEARMTALAAELWEREQPNRHFEFPLSNYISRFGPNAADRLLGAARDVLARHRPATYEERSYHFDGEDPCFGCGNYEDHSGGVEWNVSNVEDCPELHALAWRWHHVAGWLKRWCLHLVREEVPATTFEDKDRGVRTFIRVCRRCGEYGDVQEAPVYAVRPEWP